MRGGRTAVASALLGAVLLGLPGRLDAQTVLSRFEGSVEEGVFEAEYAGLAFTRALAMDPEVERVEGALISRVFTKPTARSNLEVFRSYERELRAAGFTTVIAGESGRDTELTVRALYSAPHTPAFSDRAYRATEGRVGRGELARIGTQADYYLVANRSVGGETRWVAVVLSRYEDLYMVEELVLADMETGTVTLDLDQMRSAMEQSGRIAIYDIHFATGSADIEPRSADALAIVAQYLGEAPGSFYVVGHTDDTGTLEGNLGLAQARAAAVKEALVAGHGIDPARLEARGVGPLSPVSTNAGEAGRALNRRVEIVERLGGG